MSTVIEALNKGWTISGIAKVLARGQNDEGRGFLVTLIEPKNYISHKVYLIYSVETEALLNKASMPLAA